MRNSQIAKAEALADSLRAMVAKLETLSWDIDAALSAHEKDRVGYRRRNAANPTGAANLAPGELDSAIHAAQRAADILAPAMARLASAPVIEGLQAQALAHDRAEVSRALESLTQ